MKKSNMAEGTVKTIHSPHRGQSMVEFALFLPVAVLIVAGLFDLGRAFFASITITNAAREGARYGSLNPVFYDPTSADVCLQTPYACIKAAAVVESTGSLIQLTDSMVTVSCPVSGNRCAAVQPITVTVNYTYDDMIFSFFFPSGIQMQRQEVMLVP